MDKIEKYTAFFNERLIKRDINHTLKHLFVEEDILLLSNTGLPNCDELNLCFDCNIEKIDSMIKIGYTLGGLIIYYDFKNRNIFTIYEGERKFYASNFLDFLGVIYVFENNFLDIQNEIFGEFYQNKKAYYNRFQENLLNINRDFKNIEEYIGWHIGAYLEELE